MIGNGFTKPPLLLSNKRILSREPKVNTENSLGGIVYSDAYIVDNDSRFVFGFIRSALNSGAVCANYIELLDAERTAQGWRATLRDTDGGGEFTATAKVLINAGGPSSTNSTRRLASPPSTASSSPGHPPTRAADRRQRAGAGLLRRHQPAVLCHSDGPRSVIGTTDERVDHPVTHVEDADRDFLLEQINARLSLDHR